MTKDKVFAKNDIYYNNLYN